MKIIFIILTTILITLGLNMIENKSNFSKQIIIPLIVFLLVKYIIGDLDIGYQYSIYDIVFIFLTAGISYFILAGFRI